MGNQLAQLSAAQDYTALPELGPTVSVLERLGGGRFMKSIKCAHDDGEIVIKVYTKREPSLRLSSYAELLAELRSRLAPASTPNVMPFRWFHETSHAAYLGRQHLHMSLLERMSTPPFLTGAEKRWITFQLLSALAQCHAAGVCHGDVKGENVLLTSWGWCARQQQRSKTTTTTVHDLSGWETLPEQYTDSHRR